MILRTDLRALCLPLALLSAPACRAHDHGDALDADDDIPTASAASCPAISTRHDPRQLARLASQLQGRLRAIEPDDPERPPVELHLAAVELARGMYRDGCRGLDAVAASGHAVSARRATSLLAQHCAAERRAGCVVPRDPVSIAGAAPAEPASARPGENIEHDGITRLASECEVDDAASCHKLRALATPRCTEALTAGRTLEEPTCAALLWSLDAGCKGGETIDCEEAATWRHSVRPAPR
jgi:hypothetical protein